jgi:hypothetical protein
VSDNPRRSRNLCAAVDNFTIQFPRLNFALLRPAPLRKRLWQGAGALLVLLLTFTIGNFFVAPGKSVEARETGHDFLAFYTAGTLVRLDQLDLLYDLNATREIQQTLARQNDLAIGSSFAPFWNPPTYALIFAPLSMLPYTSAQTTWRIVNLICLAAAIVLLVRMLPAIVARPPTVLRLAGDPLPLKFKRDWRNWALVPLLIAVSMPFIQALGHAQNTFMSLLLLTLVVTAWRKQMPITAGACCGLMFYKPQLAAVVAVMLVLTLGKRVCLGLGCVGGIALLITGSVMPDALGSYLTQLPLNLRALQVESTYLWERHVTFRAFWRLLIQGRGAGEISTAVNLMTILCCGIACATLGLAWWRGRARSIDDCWTGETRSQSRDRLIAATIASMPLLMPFYFDYDLLLLSVPAVLLAGEALSRPVGAMLSRSQKLLAGAWIALYLWLAVNPPIAGASGVNVTVVLLSAVAGISIARACKQGPRTVTLPTEQAQRVTVKRAA